MDNYNCTNEKQRSREEGQVQKQREIKKIKDVFNSYINKVKISEIMTNIESKF